LKLLPQSIRIFRFNSFFVKVLSLFVGIILFAVSTVGFISYASSSRLMIDEVKSSSMILLKQARDVIDLELNTLDKLTLQISLDSRVNKALYLTNEDSYRNGDNIHLFSDIRTFLGNVKSSSDFISNIWIYFNKSNLVLSNESKYGSSLFFKEIYPYEPKSGWDKVLNEYSYFRVLDNYNTKPNSEYVAFIKTLPFSEVRPYASVVINVNKAMLKNLLGNVKKESPALTYIADASGNIIITNDMENNLQINDEIMKSILSESKQGLKDGDGFLNKSFRNKRFTIAVTTSNYNGWRYVSIIPNGFIMSKADIIKNTAVIVITLSILLGVVLSYILTTRIYKPISLILSFIEMIKDNNIDKEIRESKDELSLINKIISFVYKEYRDVESAMSRNIPVLREKLLSDLLNGRSHSANFTENMKNLKMELDEGSFNVVAAFQVEEFSSYLQSMGKLSELDIEVLIDRISQSEEFSAIKVYSLRKADDIVVSLINLGVEPREPEIVLDFTRKVIEQLRKDKGMMLTAGVGRTCIGLEDIPMSYAEAFLALEYKVVKGSNTIIQIDEVSEVSEISFDYSIDKEQQIINIVKSGDINNLREVLNGILNSNLNKEGIPIEIIHNIFNALAGTAVRTIYEIHSTVEDVFGAKFNIYKKMNDYKAISEKKEYVIEVFEKIADFIARRRKNQNERVYDRILSYIHENYSSDISLNSIGDAVGLSMQYISSIFKETSGVNFLDYLNSYRVERAKEMLSDTNLSIQDIGAKSGFNNANNFIRVFKKYEGITPGQFREMILQ
jgi:two-component system, response regulator YesN